MKEKFKILSPFMQAMVLFLVGTIGYVLLSMILNVFIGNRFPEMVELSLNEQIDRFPIQFMISQFLPVQIGFILLPGIVYLFLSKEETSPIRKFNIEFSIWSLLLFGTAFLLLPFFSEINIQITKLFGVYEELFNQREASDLQLKNMVGEIGSSSYFIAIVLVGVLTGIAEELLFRRFLFRHILKNTNKFWLSLFSSSLVFVLLHFNYLQFLPLFVFGIILGWIYYASGSIIPGIILHILNNIINVYWLATDGFPDWMEAMNLKITIPSTLLLMGLILYFFRRVKPMPTH